MLKSRWTTLKFFFYGSQPNRTSELEGKYIQDGRKLEDLIACQEVAEEEEENQKNMVTCG